MTALTAAAVVPAPRAAVRGDPGSVPRAPVDQGTSGRHRAVAPTRTKRAVAVAARTGSVVTLAAMLVMAAAAAGLSDGHPPTGEAAAVATATLR